MKKIYFSKDLGEIEVINSLLRANGYHPIDSRIAPHASIAGADYFYYAEIPKEEFDIAKEFLKEQGFTNILEE